VGIGGVEYNSTKSDVIPSFLNELNSLVEKYRTTKLLTRFRKKTHVDRFYSFLRYASKRSRVVVVKGDHDADFLGNYVPEEIDRIDGCSGISGKVQQIKDLRFLGLGFDSPEDRIRRESDVPI